MMLDQYNTPVGSATIFLFLYTVTEYNRLSLLNILEQTGRKQLEYCAILSIEDELRIIPNWLFMAVR